MALEKKVIDADFLLLLEDTVAAGADSNHKIAEALDWADSTWKNYRYGRGKKKHYAKFKQPIETAIKKGIARRKDTILRIAEDAIVKQLQGWEYDEVTTTEKNIPVGRFKNGKIIWGTEISRKVVTKRVLPNAMITIFSAVNCGDGKWMSINNPPAAGDSDREGILKNIDKMLE
ncbi:MAG: hypothetical protein KAU20_02455 [Nanoarchaeota archaeon]|nr:hypothetical protein [Nanoarchaeota archaeon]